MKRFGVWLDKAAVAITSAVGSMWCAIIFTIIAIISLPDIISLTIQSSSINPVIEWLVQTFLQLVLLSIILKGQNIASKKQELIIKQISLNAAKTEAAAERIEHIVKMIEKITERELQEIKGSSEIKSKE